MRLLDRYIIRELWPSFLLALVVATLVLFVDKLLWLVEAHMQSED